MMNLLRVSAALALISAVLVTWASAVGVVISSDSVAFIARHGASTALFIVDVRTGAPLNLTHASDRVMDFAWSPDGERIAFTLWRDGLHFLYVADAHGRARDVIPGAPVNIPAPIWSLDGEQIYFLYNRPSGYSDLFRIAVHGGIPENLTNNAAATVLTPVIAPGGDQIAYAENRSGIYDIIALDLITGEERTIIASIGDDRNPSWSPDGAHIAFLSNRYGYNEPQIFVARADGTQQRLLQTPGQVSYWPPAWSPDGRMLVTSTLTSAGGSQFIHAGSHLFLMPIEGGTMTIINSRAPITNSPAWSPDGRYIALVVEDALRRVGRDLLLLDVRSGHLRQIATGLDVRSAPQWRPRSASS